MNVSKLRFQIRYMSKSKKPPVAQVANNPTGPVYLNKEGDIVMQVLAKPGAKSNSITGVDEDGVGIQINARPVDGEANAELINYISSIFGLKKSEISLDKGSKSRHKKLLISKKNLTPDIVIEKLKEEMIL